MCFLNDFFTSKNHQNLGPGDPPGPDPLNSPKGPFALYGADSAEGRDRVAPVRRGSGASGPVNFWRQLFDVFWAKNHAMKSKTLLKQSLNVVNVNDVDKKSKNCHFWVQKWPKMADFGGSKSGVFGGQKWPKIDIFWRFLTSKRGN